MQLTAAIVGPAHGLRGEVILDVRSDDPHGDLVITGAPGEALWYTVGRGRPQRYTEPIDFSQGGNLRRSWLW